jgi:hypothetical protein
MHADVGVLREACLVMYSRLREDYHRGSLPADDTTEDLDATYSSIMDPQSEFNNTPIYP